MKRCSCVLVLFAVLWVWSPCALVHAQAASPSAPVAPVVPVVPKPTPADQWVSHQMNQPPPDTGDKYALSPGLVDEIQQLYLQAKKEYESKAAHKSQDPKDPAPKSGNAVKGSR